MGERPPVLITAQALVFATIWEAHGNLGTLSLDQPNAVIGLRG